MILEITLAILGCFLGWFFSWYYYRKSSKESELFIEKVTNAIKEVMKEKGIPVERVTRRGIIKFVELLQSPHTMVTGDETVWKYCPDCGGSISERRPYDPKTDNLPKNFRGSFLPFHLTPKNGIMWTCRECGCTEVLPRGRPQIGDVYKLIR